MNRGWSWGCCHCRCFLRITRRRSSTAAPAFKMDSSTFSSSSERYGYNPTLRWNSEVEQYFIKAYGADHFALLSKSLTRPSVYSCVRVNTLKSTTDAVTEKLMSILQEQTLPCSFDCMGTSRSNGTAEIGVDGKKLSCLEDSDFPPLSDLYSRLPTELFGDTHRENLQSQSICKCQLPGMDYVLFVKGSGPHVLKYGDAPGHPLKEVIVSRKCGEAVLRGAQVFVPGVLACSSRVEKGDTVAVSVAVEQPGLDNEWGVGMTRGTVLKGLQSDPHYNERNGLYIGQGTAMMSRAGMFRASKGVAVEMTNRVYKLPSFHDVLEGEIFLQNMPSVIAAHVLGPQQGERILDMCAAPGGKTTAIAILMGDRGEVVAVDRSHNKVMNISKLAAEMGLTCIQSFRLDALRAVRRVNETIDVGSIDSNKEIFDSTIEDSGVFGDRCVDVPFVNTKERSAHLSFMECASNEKSDQRTYLSKANDRKNNRRMQNGPGRNHCMGSRVEKSKGFLPNTFDRVLLDAPCSALGLRPRLFSGEETIQSLRNHAKYQRKMFDQAVQLVRPGGVIVYSTCTINPGENEALVRYALDTYKFLTLAPQNPRIGGSGLVGHCELFNGACIEQWLTESEAELVQRFDPSSPLDTIGFFIAKFDVGQKDTVN